MSNFKKTINGLDGIGQLMGIEPYAMPKTIDFLGREAELELLHDFWTSKTYILELCGMPMIGKTALTIAFCKQNKLHYRRLEFKPAPQQPVQIIQNQLFGNKKWGDFSDISTDTLLIIENFEYALHWTPMTEYQGVHTIVEPVIRQFLDAVLQAGLKLIIETRFQINFDASQRYFVQTKKIQSIPTDHFWQFYRTKGFTKQTFSILCNTFSNHTGILALVYNNAKSLYNNDLYNIVYGTNIALKNLWQVIESILQKLSPMERQLLVALHLSQKPVGEAALLEILNSKGTIAPYMHSLCQKMLVITHANQEYSLNSYIFEVCSVFFEQSDELLTLKKLSIFKTWIPPQHNLIKQAMDRGDYDCFYKLVKIKRDQSQFDEVHQMLRYALEYDNIINKAGVLNEMAMTYKSQKIYIRAKQLLEQACALGNIHSYNELAIIYKTEKNYIQAKVILTNALKIEPHNVKLLNELAIVYKLEANYKEAKRILNRSLKINNKDIKTLTQLFMVFKLEKNNVEAEEILKQALKIAPADPYFSKQL